MYKACAYAVLLLLACLGRSHAAGNETIADVSFVVNNEFACGTIVTCMGFAESSAQGRLLLLPEYEEKASGVAVFRDRVQLVDLTSGESASFSTVFSFYVNAERLPQTGVGDGITFALVSNISWVNVSRTVDDSSRDRAFHSASLGVFAIDGGRGSSETVAVEFDTLNNDETSDKNDSHIGIDVNDNVSKTSTELEFLLSGGKVRRAWVDYNGSTHRMEVRISDRSQRPSAADLTYDNLNLAEVFDNTNWDGRVWVGFTASNGVGTSKYVVSQWSFVSSANHSSLPQATDQLGASGRASSPPPPSSSSSSLSAKITAILPLTAALTLALCAFLLGGFVDDLFAGAEVCAQQLCSSASEFTQSMPGSGIFTS
ncbi:hypothetical protein MPTK1_1g17580 [Marchantia polymorpha subsp. ruderalis]|nr:hypothetical protein MARPO_0001s0098 [Marchantia polymorpha]BBM98963.1 hypothetical protein Mp_1g17580 [Marchantia polymorpha subsp. ruderalis]|eukprot:PTQ50040.1 hypothetical protein MARPO_0001s0098 [Marchantia polymorpha]